MSRAKLNDLTAPAAEARSFDKWFFSQSKKVQNKLRESGVLPYREMVPSKHVFEINPNHRAWSTNERDPIRTEVDAFISRDHVAVMLKGFFDALAYSDNADFRRHVELIRWALSLPGCLSSRMIGKMHGVSGEAMRKRARHIQLAVNSDAAGLFPHCNSKRDKMRVSFSRH
jgi:hypothetical protein